MMDATTFQPDWVSPPGDTVKHLLMRRGRRLEDLPSLLGCSQDLATKIVDGRAAITLRIARLLHQHLGPSVEFWMARDLQYREVAARNHPRDAAWLKTLPIRDMVRFGWIPAVSPSHETEACLRFFGAPSVEAWSVRYGGLERTAFRTSAAFPSQLGPTAAWLRQGEIEAGHLDVGNWDPTRFSRTLEELRGLTRIGSPARFLPKLQQAGAECGVAIVVVRAPAGCRASGAARFETVDRAVIQLSFRHLTDDQFWFSVFHEAGHLLLHGERGLIADQGNESWILEIEGEGSSQREREADEFAANLLLPSPYQKELYSLAPASASVLSFARRVGIAPGIVVGQMQHLGLVQHSQLNHLKRRFSWGD